MFIYNVSYIGSDMFADISPSAELAQWDIERNHFAPSGWKSSEFDILQVDHAGGGERRRRTRTDKKGNCSGGGKIVRLVREFDARNAESIGLMRNAFARTGFARKDK